MVVPPLLVQRIVDDGITPGNLSLIGWLAGLMALVAVVDALLTLRDRDPVLAHR